jgi:hypothetical protein
MAESPAHRFDQIIGEVLEAAALLVLTKFAVDHHLYLDQKGPRPCRRGTKCAWVDLNGNTHDLDFVLERGGAGDKVGAPAAFIETAWRRYTKHSRNKAQEIQGAIEPLAQTYRHSGPFKGAISAGVFTDGALTQLKSLGFTVLFVPYDSVIAVFGKFGIDASFDVQTPDRDFRKKVKSYERLSSSQRAKLAAELIRAHQADVEAFVKSLSTSVSRQIESIVILALHGAIQELANVRDAIRFIEEYDDDGEGKPIERFEIQVKYSNGDTIEGNFREKRIAIEFLRAFEPVPPKVA